VAYRSTIESSWNRSRVGWPAGGSAYDRLRVMGAAAGCAYACVHHSALSTTLHFSARAKPRVVAAERRAIVTLELVAREQVTLVAISAQFPVYGPSAIV